MEKASMSSFSAALQKRPGLTTYELSRLKDGGTVYLTQDNQRIYVVGKSEKQPAWVQGHGQPLNDEQLSKVLIKTRALYQRVKPLAADTKTQTEPAPPLRDRTVKKMSLLQKAATAVRAVTTGAAPTATDPQAPGQIKALHVASGLAQLKESVFAHASVIEADPTARLHLNDRMPSDMPVTPREFVENIRPMIHSWVVKDGGGTVWKERSSAFLDKLATHMSDAGQSVDLIQLRSAASIVLRQMLASGSD